MTIETMMKERERLTAMIEEYYNMMDTGAASYSDYEIIADIKTEIRNLNKSISETIETFITPQHAGYIAGYRYFNGARIVNVYIKTFYRGRPLLTYDYTYARKYSTVQAAAGANKRLRVSGYMKKYE